MAQGFTQKLRNVIAGVGLSKSNQTLDLDINSLTEDSAPTSGDYFVFYDTTEDAHNKVDFDDIGGVTWNEETGTSATMASGNGYIANNAALVTLTMPATAAVGDKFRAMRKGAGNFRVAQVAGQTIHWLEKSTTTGTGGYIESRNAYEAIEIVCITANTDFAVISSVGNLDVS